MTRLRHFLDDARYLAARVPSYVAQARRDVRSHRLMRRLRAMPRCTTPEQAQQLTDAFIAGIRDTTVMAEAGARLARTFQERTRT